MATCSLWSRPLPAIRQEAYRSPTHHAQGQQLGTVLTGHAPGRKPGGAVCGHGCRGRRCSACIENAAAKPWNRSISTRTTAAPSSTTAGPCIRLVNSAILACAMRIRCANGCDVPAGRVARLESKKLNRPEPGMRYRYAHAYTWAPSPLVSGIHLAPAFRSSACVIPAKALTAPSIVYRAANNKW